MRSETSEAKIAISDEHLQMVFELARHWGLTPNEAIEEMVLRVWREFRRKEMH